jgi:hypothetical protein
LGQSALGVVGVLVGEDQGVAGSGELPAHALVTFGQLATSGSELW